MSRKSRIAMAVPTVGLLLASAPVDALAGSPLLSGYGGPGAGEQAVIGSTLLGGSGGGAGSDGSFGSSGSSGSGTSGAAGGGSSAGSSASAGMGSTGVAGGKGGSSAARGHGGSRATGSPSTRAGASGGGTQTRAFVYPSSLRSVSVSSPALGISGADFLLLLAMIATLALVATATLRLSRLQR